ncbi:Sensor protein FixL [Seminavis robusta]|uniref:Sensor protein FixL n=1 Tax=Seminavis robusta TaxID=568900 RepID=A0A9N8HXQ8_9STRA|nr:Sensor protein FixL [Seminavis robusta]|eukprot:Sro1850_g301550.1 Sensor protein FixL (445) ;mRNA; f:1308-2642
MSSSGLSPSARLIASTLSESSEACFLLDAEGLVLYENPAAKRLIFETTNSQFDHGAGDPKHSYHFSFFFSFTTPNKPWQEYFDHLIKSEPQSPNRRFDVMDDGVHEYYDVICKKSNGGEFPASLRLGKIGQDTDSESIYLCAYVKPKMTDDNHPFAKDGTALRCILNAAFNPMFSIDESGTILMANLAAEKTFGYTRSEFLGSNIKIICGGDHAAKHDSYLRNYLETGVKKIIGSQREVPARRKDGTEFPVELGVKEVSCLEYGVEGQVVFCAFIKDLSNEKKHQADMKHKVDLMQGMINASFDPMIEIDASGIIQNCNNATVALFGYRREEMIGQNISIIAGEEHGKNHDSYLQNYLKTGQKKVIGRKRHVKARRKDGKEFDIELGVQEVVSPSGERLFCGFIRDLTRQNMEKRRMRKQEQNMKNHFFGTQDGGTMKDHSTTM